MTTGYSLGADAGGTGYGQSSHLLPHEGLTDREAVLVRGLVAVDEHTALAVRDKDKGREELHRETARQTRVLAGQAGKPRGLANDLFLRGYKWE